MSGDGNGWPSTGQCLSNRLQVMRNMKVVWPMHVNGATCSCPFCQPSLRGDHRKPSVHTYDSQPKPGSLLPGAQQEARGRTQTLRWTMLQIALVLSKQTPPKNHQGDLPPAVPPILRYSNANPEYFILGRLASRAWTELERRRRILCTLPAGQPTE